MGNVVWQKCINPDCSSIFGIDEVHHHCPECGALLDVAYDWDCLEIPASLDYFSSLRSSSNPLDKSGVWRFRKLMPFAKDADVVSVGEGLTLLRSSDTVANYVKSSPGNVFLQYEGLNPSGSFKDNGMTAAFTHARSVSASRAACASTGNTSASLAMFAAESGFMKAIVFVGSGKIAYGKLSQALEYGAKTLQIEGDFDDAMRQVQDVSKRLGIYLVNSLNPFRLEGQKAIMYRVLEGLDWEPPDWIVVPGGNLGNSSAFGKAFMELSALGLVKRIPRLAIINSSGASTLSDLVNDHNLSWNNGRADDKIINDYYNELDRTGRKACTVASAIEIARPVNLKKCLRALDVMNGVVRAVPDQEIVDAKAVIGSGGLGCEPASAATVAGLKRLVAEGVIGPDERVACILTGHMLKDPNLTVNYHSLSENDLAAKYKEYRITTAVHSNKPISVANDLDKIIAALES